MTTLSPLLRSEHAARFEELIGPIEGYLVELSGCISDLAAATDMLCFIDELDELLESFGMLETATEEFRSLVSEVIYSLHADDEDENVAA
jgi:hypothetical protein